MRRKNALVFLAHASLLSINIYCTYMNVILSMYTVQVCTVQPRNICTYMHDFSLIYIPILVKLAIT
jgi:hypothetical protein